MAFRITNSSISTQRLHRIGIGTTASTYLVHDVSATPGITNPPISYACWYYGENTNESQLGAYTVWGTNGNGSTDYGYNLSLVQFTVTSGLTTSIGYLTTADAGTTGYGYNWVHAGSQIVFSGNCWYQDAVVSCVIPPTRPVNRWHLVTCTVEPTASVTADIARISVYDPVAATGSFAVGVFAPPGITGLPRPVFASIGNGIRTSISDSSTRNVKGVALPAILRGTSFYDGSNQTVDVRNTIAATSNGLIGHISYNNWGGRANDASGGHTGCIWATNYAANSGVNNTDSRAGKTASGSNLIVYDPTNSSFSNFHDYNRSATVVGNIISIDPYGLTSSVVYPIPTVTQIRSDFFSTDGLPAGYVLQYGATGTSLGTYLKKFTQYVSGATGTTGQIRIGVYANSRAVFPAQLELKLSDGTFTGRKMHTNFNDMGIVGQSNLWNNGRIVGGLIPIPTCMWNSNFELAENEGAYGADCSQELLRLTLSSGNVTTGLSAGLVSMVNSTLGSRFGYVSRIATTVQTLPGPDIDFWRGNGSAVRLLPGCKYRIMIRPELGLTTSDPLDIKLHLINHPSSSRIAAANCVIADSQGATANTTTAIVSIPGMGASSDFAPPSLKEITGVTAAVVSFQTNQNVYAAVRFDDSNNGFQSLTAGDMMQLYNTAEVSNVYNEAWIVRSINNKGTTSCSVTYEYGNRVNPSVGDKVTFIKSNEILKTISCTGITAPANKWRGIEIQAATSGDGLLMWGLEYRNTVRDGIVVVPIGRNGCGVRIWGARNSRISDNTNTSLTKRLLNIADFDALILSTADQGNVEQRVVLEYLNCIQNFKIDTPDTELMLYSSGLEYAAASINKSDQNDKYAYTAAMQYAGISAGIPHTAYLFGRNVSAFARIQSGDDGGGWSFNSLAHPTTVLDISFLSSQISSLQYNEPPVARINITPSTTVRDTNGDGIETLFASGISSSGDGLAYSWTTDNGLNASGVTASFNFSIGTHKIYLTVLDAYGVTNSAEANVQILTNSQPVAQIDVFPSTTVADNDNDGIENFTFSGENSYDVYGGSIINYLWIVDGVSGSTGVSFSTGLTVGNHQISLIVGDNGGLTNDTNVNVKVLEYKERERIISKFPSMIYFGQKLYTIEEFDYILKTLYGIRRK